MFNDTRTIYSKQFCHALLRQPNRLVVENSLNLHAAAWRDGEQKLCNFILNGRAVRLLFSHATTIT